MSAARDTGGAHDVAEHCEASESGGADVALPRFNWGAFLIPPVWGIAHGQWAGVFFLPLWIFVDNVLRGPQLLGAAGVVAGWLLAAATLGIQAAYAAHANEHAWRRAAGTVTVERFVRAQRRWAVAGALSIAFMAAAIVSHLAS